MTEDGRRPPDERDARLDRALDLALRQMSGGDGPADMRRRVLARLDEPPRRTVVRRAVLAAAAAIALAAGTAALLRGPAIHAPETRIARREGSPVRPSTLPSPATAHRIEPAPAAPRAVRPTSRWVARRPSPEIPIANEPGADDAPMAPIEPVPLGLAPMQAEALTIAPLRMDPMEITPLAEPRSE